MNKFENWGVMEVMVKGEWRVSHPLGQIILSYGIDQSRAKLCS